MTNSLLILSHLVQYLVLESVLNPGCTVKSLFSNLLTIHLLEKGDDKKQVCARVCGLPYLCLLFHCCL